MFGTFGEEQIQVCESHQRKEITPLIRTFVFPYSEQRCPRCGRKYDMHGGKSIDKTYILEKRLAKYKEKSKGYLHAVGTLTCNRYKEKGARYDRSQMSERRVKYNKALISKYIFKK